MEVTEVAARPPWRVRSDEAGLTLDTNGTDGSSGGSSDPVAALRALCAVHWAASGGEVVVRAGDGAAADALCALGLSAG
ncbi:MAG: hypothetical protein H0V92_10640 [Pseudonocardiales bacterium]|nr:hypothetical protein [Pseudonocardiales bacterium]